MSKKLIVAGFSVIFAIAQACSGLLDEKVVSGVTPQYLNTKEGFEDALKGAYSSLRSFYASERGMSLTVFGTDTYTNGADGELKFVNQYTSQFDSRTVILNDVWNEFYKAINAANAVIDRANQIQGLDENLKTIRVAEAKFLRAHYYFILVQLFGDIPLQLTEVLVPTTEAHRASLSEVYNAVVEDLEQAAQNLPDKQQDWGRATKPAAEHLLARVHLTRASMDGSITPSEEYQKAATLAQKVINDYGFSLLDDFAKVFEQGSGEVNNEVIWSVQYTNNPLTNFQPGNPLNTGNNAHHFFLMEYDQLPGMQRDIENGRPFKRFKPTEYALSLWNRQIDSRYSKSFKTVFYANNANNIPKDENGNPKYNLGDTAVWLPGVELPKEVVENKSYLVILPSQYTLKLYPTLSKFLDPLRPSITTFEGSRDFLAFRLAETYLIASEAMFKLGEMEDATSFMNEVRRRGAFPGKESLMEITPDQLSMDFILEERERELLGEQFRWFDLVRTGRLVDQVKKYNPDASPNIQEYHSLRPIPQNQIDRTRNSNGQDFDQNEGY